MEEITGEKNIGAEGSAADAPSLERNIELIASVSESKDRANHWLEQLDGKLEEIARQLAANESPTEIPSFERL